MTADGKEVLGIILKLGLFSGPGTAQVLPTESEIQYRCIFWEQRIWHTKCRANIITAYAQHMHLLQREIVNRHRMSTCRAGRYAQLNESVYIFNPS